MKEPPADYNRLRKTSWCSLPWTHLFIDPQGRVKPCCRFALPKDAGAENNIHKQSPSEIFFSPFMNKIRKDMLNNKKIKGCIRCYEEEASAKKSLRERYNERADMPPETLIESLDRPKIRFIEAAASNLCNLACRMCDSRYSRLWFDAEKEFGKTFSRTKNLSWNILTLFPFLKDAVHIKFTGGEPLMEAQNMRLLDRLTESGRAGSVFLSYSVNLTVPPSRRLIKAWKRFRFVEIAASFDGINAAWELVRWPSLWKKAEKVLQTFFRLTHEMDLRVQLRSTVSVNNILHIGESFDWWIANCNRLAAAPFDESVNPVHVSFPRFLSATVLPLKFKEIAARKLQRDASRFSGAMKAGLESLIRYMMSRDDSARLAELKRYTLHFDKKRGQDFFKVNPEFRGLFDDLP